MRLDDPGAPAEIARLLAATLSEAPYRVPEEGGDSSPVYELRLESVEHGAPLLILLWPSLARVDVRLGASTWTLKGVSGVELYPGVEALFRREEPSALLFVSVSGRVALVA